MDIVTFQTELAEALSKELIARAKDLAIHEMKSFDLGIHPWHGYIEPSFLTTQDSAGPKEVGDWKLYNFADTDTEKWPAVKHLANWMRAFYEANPDKNSAQLFVAAAAAVKSGVVAKALQRYRTTSTFSVSVFNPDDPSFANYCA